MSQFSLHKVDGVLNRKPKFLIYFKCNNSWQKVKLKKKLYLEKWKVKAIISYVCLPYHVCGLPQEPCVFMRCIKCSKSHVRVLTHFTVWVKSSQNSYKCASKSVSAWVWTLRLGQRLQKEKITKTSKNHHIVSVVAAFVCLDVFVSWCWFCWSVALFLLLYVIVLC